MKLYILLLATIIVAGCASAPKVDWDPPADDPAFDSIGMRLDQMLLVKTERGIALIDIVSIDEDPEKPSSYRWRFKPANGGPEQSGKGVVFEKYIETKTGPNRSFVEDDGGQLTIKAGKIEVEWSPHTVSSCWIYFGEDDKAKRKLLPDTNFATYKLK